MKVRYSPNHYLLLLIVVRFIEAGYMDMLAYTKHIPFMYLIEAQTTIYIQLLHYWYVLLAGKTMHDNLQIK